MQMPKLDQKHHSRKLAVFPDIPLVDVIWLVDISDSTMIRAARRVMGTGRTYKSIDSPASSDTVSTHL